MAKQNIINTNFTSGEVSPLVRGRVDAQKYGNGLETCENFIVRPQGPIWRRSGTEMIKPTKFGTSKSRLVPFEYSDLSGYVLEFGAGYIHFYKDGLPLWETTKAEIEDFTIAQNDSHMRIVAAETPYDLPGWGPLSQIAGQSLQDNGTLTISSGTGGVVRITTSIPHTMRTGVSVIVKSTQIPALDGQTKKITRISGYVLELDGTTYGTPSAGYTCIFGHGLQAGDRVYIKSNNTTYPTLYNRSHLVWNITSVAGVSTANNFDINVPYVSGAEPTTEKAHVIPIEIVTPYSESDLPELRFVQSADVLYVMHPDHPVYKLTRLDNDGDVNDWFWAEVEFEDGPYLPLNSLAPKLDETNPQNGTRFADVYMQLTDYSHTATATAQKFKCTITNNAGNVLITTETPHGLTSGDLVVISGTGIAGIDGNRIVDGSPAPTPTTFEINVAYTANASGFYQYPFLNLDDDDYIEYRDGDQWRLARLGNVADYDVSATVTVIDNVLLFLDETVKFKNTYRDRFGKTKTYDAGSPNMTPSLPGAAKQSKIDPNNYCESGASAAAAGTITANYSNTFGLPDIGKYIRYFNSGLVVRWAKITDVTQASSGKQCKHGAALTMAANNNLAGYVISNHQRTAKLRSFKAGSAFDAFASTDVDRVFRIGWGGRWTWGKITAYTNASEVDVLLYEDVPRDPHNAENLAGALNGKEGTSSSTGRSYDWRMGSWSETTGYPSCGVFHEQRLWFGRTDTEPQTIWGSIAGDFENFSPTELDSAVLEDNAVNFTIASTKANPIKWMVSGPAIAVGTTGGEWQVKSSSVSSEPITPLNIVVVPHTSHGSHSSVQPIKIGNSILFADRAGNRVRELIYDFSVDALVSRDLSYLSEHMFRDRDSAEDCAYQQEPNNICWYALGDGTLAAVTINRDQEVVAWHHHTIQDGSVENIAVVPSSDSTRDDVYMIVLRGSNRYIELLKPDFYPENASTKTGMRYLDSHVTLLNFSGTKVRGLNHLNGKTVTVTSNGTLLGTYAVSSGGFALAAGDSQSDKELVVGLPYTSTAKSLPPEGGSAFGVSQGKIKKLVKYNVRLLNSLALDYGFNSNGQNLNSITNLHENGTSTDFYTGTKELIPNNPYDAESQWTLSTNKPYPLNILSVTLTVETGE